MNGMLIINTILAIILIALIILQRSYINDTLHALTNPTEHFLSYQDRNLMIITGIVSFLFLLTLVI